MMTGQMSRQLPCRYYSQELLTLSYSTLHECTDSAVYEDLTCLAAVCEAGLCVTSCCSEPCVATPLRQGEMRCLRTRCIMQRAYLVAEDPTAPNFWHKVAQHVPGKTAQECQNRLWAAHPTPKGSKGGNPGAYALAAEADSDTSPLMPPPRKNAAGINWKISSSCMGPQTLEWLPGLGLTM